MKYVILAGGTGTRLKHLTLGVNKHLLPIGDKPILWRQLDAAYDLGHNDVLVVTSPDAIQSLSKLACEHKIQAYFAIQKEPRGIANAILSCMDYCKNDRFTVVLGDNIFSNYDQFSNQAQSPSIWVTKCDNPESYGILYYKDDKPHKIVEKPTDKLSNTAIVGIYTFDNDVFSIIQSTKPSLRGEYEITDVINEYLRMDRLVIRSLEGSWLDIGNSVESYGKANEWYHKTTIKHQPNTIAERNPGWD